MTSGRDEYISRHIDYEAESKRRYSWVSKTGGLANGGLTVRDYFAAKAMAALVSDTDWRQDMEGWSDAAFAAYAMADAMMKARELDKQGEL